MGGGRWSGLGVGTVQYIGILLVVQCTPCTRLEYRSCHTLRYHTYAVAAPVLLFRRGSTTLCERSMERADDVRKEEYTFSCVLKGS